MGMVDLARRLNLSVVAEGVETAAQHARLRDMGCAYGQGFHFAHPMPAVRLRRYLRSASSPAPHGTTPVAATVGAAVAIPKPARRRRLAS